METVFSTVFESKEEFLNDEFSISSKSLGMFSVEIYRSPEGQILGGIICRPEVSGSYKVIDLDGSLKFDIIYKLIIVKVSGNDNKVNTIATVSHLQQGQMGRQIVSTEEESLGKLISLGNLTTLDTKILTGSLLDIIHPFIE